MTNTNNEEKGKLIRAIRKLLIDNEQPAKLVEWYEDNFSVVKLRRELKELRSKYKTRQHGQGCVVEKPRTPQHTGSVAEDSESETIFEDVRTACKKGAKLKLEVTGEAKKLKFHTPLLTRHRNEQA